ncbi:MAG TPA: glycosyltransferase [Polyangia bacterium]|nr:glycosyltransferase [Polyangia bacterium]
MPKTVAIFTDGGFLAHVTRSFEVGRAIGAQYGHRVVFCGSGPYMHIPLDAGYRVWPVYTVDRERTMTLARRAGLCSLPWWRSECERSVRSDLEILDRLQPDLAVGDMHWSLCTSARAAGVPYVAITNGAWTRWYSEPIEPPAGHFSTRILGPRLCRRVFPLIKDLLVRYYALGYTEVRRRLGLPPVHSLYDLIEGDLTLMADLPELAPTTAGRPDSCRYVGPILWSPDLPAPAWLERLDPGRPTLYFTMGSTGDAEFFNQAIRVFGDTEYQILITTGGLADLGAVPRNVFVERYAPGEALMQRSDLVVSHGGNGTIYQALSCGVPVIGFPTMFDQEINMQRVCALGAGIRMWRRAYDARSLERAVEKVVGDPGYRVRCRDLARRIAELDGPRLAARYVSHLLSADPVAGGSARRARAAQRPLTAALAGA